MQRTPRIMFQGLLQSEIEIFFAVIPNLWWCDADVMWRCLCDMWMMDDEGFGRPHPEPNNSSPPSITPTQQLCLVPIFPAIILSKSTFVPQQYGSLKVPTALRHTAKRYIKDSLKGKQTCQGGNHSGRHRRENGGVTMVSTPTWRHPIPPRCCTQDGAVRHPSLCLKAVGSNMFLLQEAYMH